MNETQQQPPPPAPSVQFAAPQTPPGSLAVIFAVFTILFSTLAIPVLWSGMVEADSAPKQAAAAAIAAALAVVPYCIMRACELIKRA